MGVHGLWQLLGSTGKPVSLDSLEGKVLAVDVSVWLHQLSKGMRDSDGNPIPHAHLHGLFTRICKLLYYRIKPVFVFDGGVPVLKKQTLAGRREKRDVAEKESSRLQQKLLTNLIRSQAVKESLGLDKAPQLPHVHKKPSRDAVFELAPLTESSERYLKANEDLDEAFDERRELQQIVEENYGDLNKIDVDSEEFLSLPTDIQHEIIMDMKERRKTYKMSRRTALPEDSKDFSKFQVAKLLKQSKLTLRLDDIRKELNTKTAEVSKHLADSLYGKQVQTRRVISEDASHSVLIKGLRDTKQKEDDSDKKRKLLRAEFPAISEESSNSDELMLDSGSDERGDMDFRNPDQLSVIGKAIIDPNVSYHSDKPGKNSDFRRTDQNANNNKFVTTSSDSVVGDKPIFRPVIEIDTDSDSSSEDDSFQDSSKKPVKHTANAKAMKLIPRTVNENSDDEVMIIDDSELMDDVQANRDLQLAIEKSLQDQIKTTSTALTGGLSKSGRTSGKSKSIFQKQISNRSVVSDEGSKFDEQNESVAAMSTRRSIKDSSKSIFQKQISNRSIVSDEGSKSDEQNESISVIGTRRSIKDSSKSIFQKQISNISNVSDEELIDDRMDTDTTQSKQDSRLLKRKASDTIVEGSATKQQRKGSPQVIASKNGNLEESPHEVSSSTESEDVFLEVKIDPENVAEDELFPASLFEAKPLTSDLGDTSNNETITSKIDKSPKESRETAEQTIANGIHKSLIQDSDSIQRENADRMKIMIQDSDILQENEDQTKNKSSDMEAFPDGIVKENQGIQMKNVSSADTEATVHGIVKENQGDEVFDGIQDGVVPDVVETRSGSSVSSLPDIVENTDEMVAEERPRSVSPKVPDLVKDYQNLDFQTLSGMRDNLAAESRALQKERGRQERLAMSISDQMHSEAQELLRLFGVPYIVSPTEAEAQCAQLDILKLTQGTITDDSDIWLFGGTSVYRNFFNQQKHVEFYRDVHILSQLGLTREKLINLALLCGSDYTDGIQGVGPVTAMEILLEFPGDGLEGLLALKSWWEAAQQQYVKPKESKLKTKIRELDISPGFPSVHVVEAYMSPTVEDSAEAFSWGSPDVDGLRHFIGVKLGWSAEKVDEHLQPVLKRLQDKQSQRRISSYFQPEQYIEPAKVKSKRLQKVVDKFLKPSAEPDQEDITDNKTTKSKTKRSKNPGAELDQEDVISDNKTTKLKTKRSKVQNISKNNDDIKDMENEIKEVEVEEKIAVDVKTGKGRGQGRGRGRGRGRGQEQLGREEAVEVSRSRSTRSQSSKKAANSAGSSSSSESDSEISGRESIDSDDEIDVIEKGVNVAEILGLTGFVSKDIDVDYEKMENEGDKSDNGQESEKEVNEAEILGLTGFQSPFSHTPHQYPKDIDVEFEKMEIDVDQSDDVGDSDTSVSESEFFKNEGGFVREEDESVEEGKSEIVEAPRAQIMQDILKQLEAAKSKYFESEVSQGEDTVDNIKDTGVKGVIESAGIPAIDANEVPVPAVTDIAAVVGKEDKSKNETHTNEENKTSASFPQGNVDYEKKIRNILHEDQPESKVNVKTEEINEDFTKGGNSVNANSKAKRDKAATSVDENQSDLIPNSRSEKGQPVSGKGKEKTKPTEVSTVESTKTLVTGVPWASKKGKPKSGKGKARTKGRNVEPVEKIVRKSTQSTKGSKPSVGVVNLSESDSDSGD